MDPKHMRFSLMHSAVNAYTLVWFATSEFDPETEAGDALLADLEAHPGGFGELAASALNSRGTDQSRDLRRLRLATSKSMTALERLVEEWPELDLGPDELADARQALITLYIDTTVFQQRYAET